MSPGAAAAAAAAAATAAGEDGASGDWGANSSDRSSGFNGGGRVASSGASRGSKIISSKQRERRAEFELEPTRKRRPSRRNTIAGQHGESSYLPSEQWELFRREAIYDREGANNSSVISKEQQRKQKQQQKQQQHRQKQEQQEAGESTCVAATSPPLAPDWPSLASFAHVCPLAARKCAARRPRGAAAALRGDCGGPAWPAEGASATCDIDGLPWRRRRRRRMRRQLHQWAAPPPEACCGRANKSLLFRLLQLAALALLLLSPASPLCRAQLGQAEPLGQPEGPLSTRDELSRAVLATMSTQSPVQARDQEPLAGKLAAVSWQATNESQARLQTQVQPQPQIQLEEQQTSAGLLEQVLQFCRIFLMGAIIVGDICGNSLVILSVCRHSKLRVTTNWFVVSLACADILVALFAMTFNASVIISGRWLFKPWVCDFWNSCDVLASTASILHLCCISIDRYIAIMRPLDYPMKITTRRVVYALCAVWISSALLSYIPIFTGVYTTAEHIQWLKDNPDQCEFVVNRVYAVVSSSISFWIPCCIMVFTYYRIYREATRQEKFIYKAQSMMPAPKANHHQQQQQQHGNHCQTGGGRSKQRRSKSVALASSLGAAGNEARIRQLARQQQQQQRELELEQERPAGPIATTRLSAAGGVPGIVVSEGGGERAASMLQLDQAESEPLAGGGGQLALRPAACECAGQEEADAEGEGEAEGEELESNSGQSTPTKRSISKMKREHKAAKTLGIIMGVFILCWLPFFSWYTPQHICGHACDGMVPRGAVTILFWIGYFNSTLNPIIYAYFNHEFRDAFKKTLQWIFCCCNDLKCLRVNRPNDNQHYNCTYRSTQEIGLVNNG